MQQAYAPNLDSSIFYKDNLDNEQGPRVDEPQLLIHTVIILTEIAI